MNHQNVYVIRDRGGNYISPRHTKRGWFFVTYTGDTTGFTFYSNIEAAQGEVKILNNLGNDFYLEQVDFKSIPKGRRVSL